jgi:hypothetical protein
MALGAGAAHERVASVQACTCCLPWALRSQQPQTQAVRSQHACHSLAAWHGHARARGLCSPCAPEVGWLRRPACAPPTVRGEAEVQHALPVLRQRRSCLVHPARGDQRARAQRPDHDLHILLAGQKGLLSNGWAAEERSRACLVTCRACEQHKWQRWNNASATLTRRRYGHACHLCCRGE